MVRKPALWKQFYLGPMRSGQKQTVRNLTMRLLGATVRVAGSAPKINSHKRANRLDRVTISSASRKAVRRPPNPSRQKDVRAATARRAHKEGRKESVTPAHPLPHQEAQRAGRVRSDDPIARRASQVIMKTPVSDDWRSFLRARAAPTSPVSRPKMLPARAQRRDARSGHAHAAQAVIG